MGGIKVVDLHRHDEYSTFDGFGKAPELVAIAKKLGHTSLGTSNHGNTSGLIQTYTACKEAGIKPILGVEGYFLPKYKAKERGFHLCLFAKDLQGYKNLNTIQYEGEKQKYYNPIITFDILKKYHEGVICTTACVGGYLAQCIVKGKFDLAEKYLLEMVSIFGDDFYIEIQPYKVSEPGMQEKVNYHSILLAEKYNIKCILTSDSHYTRPEDFPTYLKLHHIASHNLEQIEATYKERYMPTEKEIVERFVMMHTDSLAELKEYCIDGSITYAQKMVKNLEEIESKVEDDIFSGLELKLPTFCNTKKESKKKIIDKIKEGLKSRCKLNKQYIDRCKEELDVISYHGFEDYFLIVEDYVNWAKSKGIGVGPGRGSVCNCLVAYALGITDVDSILLNLDFRRFLRKDKKKFPDIDLDFQTSRRQEVIQYLCEKYKGHAAKICSYGLYQVDNLVNDLAKVSGLLIDKKQDEYIADQNKTVISLIKTLCNKYINENGELEKELLLNDPQVKEINKSHDNIILHFSKIFKKIRYMGTHAAGVAITGGDLLAYTSLTVKDSECYTSYDLSDLEQVQILKFDILGLKTMESIMDLRNATGVTANYDTMIYDKKIMKEFNKGECDGIFQFEKRTARNILQAIDADCFDDIMAATSMNRPGPLQQHMPEKYAENKNNIDEARQAKYYEYAKETYGTIIYQEQLQQICLNVGGMDWAQADKMLKVMKHGEANARTLLQKMVEKKEDDLQKIFVQNAIKCGYEKQEARDLFDNMLVYSFNKGHAAGYSLLSVEEMFYKVYFPLQYWYVKIKYARDDAELAKFTEKCSVDSVVVFFPHVNYSVNTTLRKVDGEQAVQLGLTYYKGVGEKAAIAIYEERKKNGIFKSFDDFYDRCKSRSVTSKVITILQENGALEFNKEAYLRRVLQYNSALYTRGLR